MQFIPAVILNAKVEYATDEDGTDYISSDPIFGMPRKKLKWSIQETVQKFHTPKKTTMCPWPLAMVIRKDVS